MDVKEHKMNFLGNRLVLSFQLNKKKMNTGDFCDNETWVKMNDPRTYEYLLFDSVHDSGHRFN